MKQLVTGTAFLALFAPLAPAGNARWLTSYEDALAAAKEAEKVVLADFTGSDWCGSCMKLKKEVFDTAEFGKWAEEKAVLLEVDFPVGKPQSAKVRKQNEELRRRHNVEGFPTIVFLGPDGAEIGRTGYVQGGPSAWIERAEGILGKRKPKAEAPAWLESYYEAAALSKKTGRPILADFTGSDWCGWCIKLKKEVFDTPEFRKWAAEHVVLLEVDFPAQKRQTAARKKENTALASKYGVTGFPTILFLDATGRKLGELGYRAGGPGGWIEEAEKIVGRRSAGGDEAK